MTGLSSAKLIHHKTLAQHRNLQMTQNSPKVSIIVPIYNTGKYLKRCLNSIVNQTYQNLEIILVDDGSTDDSKAIAKEFAQKDSRIKLLNQSNSGLSSARNAGIRKATGKYLTLVDSDDEIELNMIENMLSSLQSSHADIVVCSFKEIYPGNKIVHFNKNYPQKTYNTKSALTAMLKEQGFMLSATMKLFPTEYFKNVTFPVSKLHEDVGTTYKLIMQAKKIIFLPKEYYIYHHHDNSITSNKFNNRKLDLIELTDQMCNDIEQKYPDLKNITNERRIRARFSILRQIPIKNPETKTLLNYLRNNKSYILKNPEATATDKIALVLALTNLKLFQFAYRIKKA